MMTDRKSDYWWRKDEGEAGKAVFNAVQFLDDSQGQLREAYLHFLRLYSNRQALGFMGSEFLASPDSGNIIRLNVVKSCIDTAVAHIATQRPRPMHLTMDGDYEQRQRAQRLDKFMLGQFLAMRRYLLGLQIFRDAAIFGCGVEKFYAHNGRICSERVFPDELVHDHREATGGAVRQLFHVHNNLSREVLAELYPDKWSEIEGAKRINRHTEDGFEDCPTVIEAWHLPSGPDAKDGRHVIAIDNCTLSDEPLERERFPFSFFNWSDPVRGLFGIGVAEELAPIQREVNYIAQKIQRLMTLATSFVWKEKGSGVGKIVNKDFAQYEYTGRPPVFQTVASVSSEYFNHLDRLYQRAFEIVGISQLAAQSRKPAGLDSGEALKVYNDIGTKRFQHVGQRWEQFHLDAAECIYDVATDIYEAGEGVDVLVAGDRDVERINFSDAYLERDKYVMQPHPVSLLPDTPAGQVDMIVKLAQGVPDMAPYLPMMLAGIPDVKALVDRMTAPIKIAEMQVQAILDGRSAEKPYELMDLRLTRDIATKSVLQAVRDGVPEGRVDKLRQYIAEVDALQAKAEQATPPMGPQSAPGMPPGGPALPPGPLPPPSPGLPTPPM